MFGMKAGLVVRLARVFERFRSDLARGGSGPATVEVMVEAYGGRISAQDAGLGRGATCRIALPARSG